MLRRAVLHVRAAATRTRWRYATAKTGTSRCAPEVADPVRDWEEPFEAFQYDRSAWRLFNPVTFALNGWIAENPSVTRTLHDVIDGVCV
jgi:hypothetical protein